MFLRDLALKATRRAGLAHGDNVPADIFGQAVDTVATALRFYSDSDTITCFSQHRTVTIGTETTIGLPALRRGVKLHNIAEENGLPDLSDYSPDDGSYVMGLDFWHCDDTDYFYAIRHSDTDGYFFEVCQQDEFATTTADIYMKDLAKIISIFDADGVQLHPVSLSKFFGLDCGVFSESVDGNGRKRIFVKSAGNYEIVYTRALAFNENTQVDLPASQEEMVVLHTAWKMARSSDRKASLKAELDEATAAATDSALSYTIPTRSLD